MPRYTLMNKDTAVLEFDYDEELHAATKITAVINPSYAPLAIVNAQGEITRRALNSWWQSRAIPATRQQIHQVLDELSLDSTLSLAEKNCGLSLSDRYWIKQESFPLKWDAINFFDNEFSGDLGFLTLGQSSVNNPNLFSPNSTLGGDLRKRWEIAKGERVLVKEGVGAFNQEVYNEVVATRLFERLLSANSFVPYTLMVEGDESYCVCRNMLQEDEELVPAYDIFSHFKHSNQLNDSPFFLQCCAALEIPDVATRLSEMFGCDYLIANRDRHWYNFGAIRNVETLKFERIAPIFDTGSCLWSNKKVLSTPIDFEYSAKPFGIQGMKPEKQLQLLSDFSWFDKGKLEGFTEEMAAILTQNPLMPESRIAQICKEVEKRIEHLSQLALRKSLP